MKGDVFISLKPWEQSDYDPRSVGYTGFCSENNGPLPCGELAVFTGEFNTGTWAQCLPHAVANIWAHATDKPLITIG